jgi:hypothetical protein
MTEQHGGITQQQGINRRMDNARHTIPALFLARLYPFEIEATLDAA